MLLIINILTRLKLINSNDIILKYSKLELNTFTQIQFSNIFNRNKSVVDIIYYDINYDYRENGYLKLTHYLC